MGKKQFTIWMEGFAATGQSQGASCLGVYEDKDFNSAVQQLLQRDPDLKAYYSQRSDNHYIWGCRLYDNETDARKNFG